MKRWNFHKADWKRFCLLIDESFGRLPPPNTSNIERTYQEFCERLSSTAKQCIPHGRRKNYVPCWDKECETLHCSFTQAPVGTDLDRATLSLLSWLQQKKQERWEEAVNSINFSHSSRKAWRTINKLTGRSGHSLCQCPVLAKSITMRLVKNVAHRIRYRESTRLINKELSDRWKVSTPEVHSISEPFRAEELAAALRCLGPARKVSRIGHYFSRGYTPHQVGSQILVLLLPQFLHAPTQNSI